MKKSEVLKNLNHQIWWAETNQEEKEIIELIFALVALKIVLWWSASL
ncbi:hypothetical protein N9489_03030 [Methylophilaceae bacterium]|jgi:hypothetical protein|nr:hypothetical protein [Methylophilaceae bacterium]MDC0423332.1 hypothetical protein [Methylophilaceae bacterium]